MFVGHYSTALAARALKPAIPLWVLFLAVQIVDFAWSVLVLLGIEKVRVIPGYTAASPLDLYHMPYTHSVVATFGWAIGAGCLYALIRRGPQAMLAGGIVALAVVSHWALDWLVHVPDLPLVYGEPKFGLGLWNYFWPSQVLEAALLILGTALYVRFTAPRNGLGRWTPWLLLLALGGVQTISHLPGVQVPSPQQFAIQAFATYALLVGLAALVDLTRRPRP